MSHTERYHLTAANFILHGIFREKKVLNLSNYGHLNPLYCFFSSLRNRIPKLCSIFCLPLTRFFKHNFNIWNNYLKFLSGNNVFYWWFFIWTILIWSWVNAIALNSKSTWKMLLELDFSVVSLSTKAEIYLPLIFRFNMSNI